MNLKLIQPEFIVKDKTNKKQVKFPPLQLAVLASLTPDDVDVEIVHEPSRERELFDDQADLVAITFMTHQAPRAYEVADWYRFRGIKVIMGGVHASVLPYEALKHCDSVVIGEAEGLWRGVINDFRHDGLKQTYSCADPLDLAGLPLPRRDLYEKGKYFMESMYVSRGCPFNCNYCCVSSLYGRGYRFKPVGDILQEISSLDGKMFMLADDNIVGNSNYAKELFGQMRHLNTEWVGPASINVASNLDMLKLLADSGCKMLFIGFESLSDQALQNAGKLHNRVENYKDAIETIHNYGINILGCFMFGFDEDDSLVFRKTVDFARDTGIELCHFSIRTPFPGTRLYQELDESKRILDFDWIHYNTAHTIFAPRNMSTDVLQKGYDWAYKEFYRYGAIARRLVKTRRNLKLLLPANLGYRKLFCG